MHWHRGASAGLGLWQAVEMGRGVAKVQEVREGLR